MPRRIAVLTVLTMLLTIPTWAASYKTLKLVRHDGGFFKIDKPEGWKVTTAGRGATLAILVRDPSCSLRQFFCFTQIGPFYVTQDHKALETSYSQGGGFPVQWLDMPVVNPLTTSNFFANWEAISKTKIARGFMPGMPSLEDFQLISKRPQPSPGQGFSVEVVRGLFKQDGKLGEGLFGAAVGNNPPYGVAFLASGVTAPKRELAQLAPIMLKSLASFDLSKDYVEKCKKEQKENFEGLLQAGKTWSECSDIITKGYAARTKSEDILSEKRSDATLGKERLYDPETNTVYEFPNGFYADTYRQHPEVCKIRTLKPIPDNDHKTWTTPTRDGRQIMN